MAERQELVAVEKQTVEIPVPVRFGRFVTATRGRPVAFMATTTDCELWEWIQARCPEVNDVTKFSAVDVADVLGTDRRTANRRVARLRRAGLIYQYLRPDTMQFGDPPLTMRVWPHDLEVGDVFLQVAL